MPAPVEYGSGIAIDVRIATFEPIRVACIRDVGAWPDVSPCLQQLFRWAATLGAPTGRLLTLSFQLPDAAQSQRWYWKAGVEMFTHERPPPGIEFDTLGAGRHAVHRLVGPHEKIGERTGGCSRSGYPAAARPLQNARAWSCIAIRPPRSSQRA